MFVGVNPSDMTDKDSCAPDEESSECTSVLNSDFIELVKTNITTGSEDDEYFYTYTTSELWNSSATVPSTCTESGA